MNKRPLDRSVIHSANSLDAVDLQTALSLLGDSHEPNLRDVWDARKSRVNILTRSGVGHAAKRCIDPMANARIH